MSGRAGVLQVAVPAPVMGVYDYLPPAGADTTVAPGQRVLVPFGRSTRVGFLVGTKATSALPTDQLRHAIRMLDVQPLLAPDLMRLVTWASQYYQHPPGEVFATAVPKALRDGDGTARGELRWVLSVAGQAADPEQLRRARVQAEILIALQAHPQGLAATALEALTPGWRRALKSLAGRDWVREVAMPLTLATATVEPDVPPVLTAAQERAVAAISLATGYRCFLLDGVTGSGKTEVYLRCIRRALEAGKQSLVLVPEIVLTPQLLDRFRRRFPVPIAEVHSGLSDGERLRSWSAARDGSAAIVIGTRSAIFTPLARPGLLVVDEEHDGSYKQQDGFHYSARDLAVWRARDLGIPLVLGSATPSLETLENARGGRYERLVLPGRTGTAGQPTVHVVDLRANPPREGLSQPLRAAIRRHLDAGGQALVYLNRRGFAPTLMCPGCGFVLNCDRCDARMVLHQRRNRVICHHCGSERPAPPVCPDCSSPLTPVGQGTERIEQALAAAFPAEALVRIDRDTIRRRGDMERQLNRVRSAEARLLMGTQMLTKGHDFPRVTLVGIVDADQGLFGTDFRSAERLAQSFIQVAGRAGRADRPGEVYLQTLFPDHPLLRVLIGEGYGRFAEVALAERRRAGWPPYAFLALLRAEAAQRPSAFSFLEAAASVGRELAPAGVRILGPAPAPMARRSGRFRGQVLVQTSTRRDLQQFLPGWRAAIAALPTQRRARWSLDVDPIELF